MELYHIHTKGIRDDKWKENKEIVITDDFINRLGKMCNDFNDCISSNQFSEVCYKINENLMYSGYEIFNDMPIYLIINQLLIDEKNGNLDKDTMLKALKIVRNLSYNSSIFKREMAMEQHRKDNNSNLPSRLHCIYATDEKGVMTWINTLVNGEKEIYRIDVIDEPFKTSEIFIPSESCSYKDMYENSYRYWNPKFKNVNERFNEYLVKGKVKILEKVDEIKKI